jgi:hypothetical protein
MSGWTNFVKSVAGAFGDQTTAGQELVESGWDVIAQFTKPAADGMASTTTAATKGNDVNAIGGGFSNIYPYDLEVVGFSITPNAALTADAANNAVISILTDDAADGAPVACFSLTTSIAAPGSGNWATDVLQTVTKATAVAGTKGSYTASAARLRPGANLFVSIAKNGTGVVVPISMIYVIMRKR